MQAAHSTIAALQQQSAQKDTALEVAESENLDLRQQLAAVQNELEALRCGRLAAVQQDLPTQPGQQGIQQDPTPVQPPAQPATPHSLMPAYFIHSGSLYGEWEVLDSGSFGIVRRLLICLVLLLAALHHANLLVTSDQ